VKARDGLNPTISSQFLTIQSFEVNFMSGTDLLGTNQDYEVARRVKAFNDLYPTIHSQFLTIQSFEMNFKSGTDLLGTNQDYEVARRANHWM
jgi:hypothetical protein